MGEAEGTSGSRSNVKEMEELQKELSHREDSLRQQGEDKQVSFFPSPEPSSGLSGRWSCRRSRMEEEESQTESSQSQEVLLLQL